MPRLCEEKHVIVLELPPSELDGCIKVTYANLIMWGFILTVVYRGYPLLCDLVTQIDLDNPHTKGDTKLWFDPTFFTLASTACNSLVDTQPADLSVDQQHKRTKNMFDDDEFNGETRSNETEAERTRRFFLNELSAETDDAIDKARKKFRIEPDTPKTFNEMIQRIQAGKFQIKHQRQKHLDSDLHFNPYSAADWIEWRDPGTEPDEAGYSKAIETIRNRQTELGHQIRVANLYDLPDCIKEMKAVTLH